MLRIYIARHGQDWDNASGILNGRRDQPLTAFGLAQANALTEEIKQAGLSFNAIYSSPLARAYRTAEVIAFALNAPKPIPMIGLIERDFGAMAGKQIKDIERLCAPKIIKGDPVVYFLEPENGETFPQVLERAKTVIAEVQAAFPDGNVLLVTHGDIGKMLFAAYYGLEWQSVLTQFHFGNAELLLLAPDASPETAHVFKLQQQNH